MSLKPLGDRVLLKILKQKKTENLHLPHTAKEKPQKEVVAVEPEVTSDGKGSCEVKVGDK